MVSAHSLAFDPTGTRLYAGLKNEIRIFDVSQPGRKCSQRKTWSKKEGGQPGIVSCIAVSYSCYGYRLCCSILIDVLPEHQ